jgi:hypothetical protein
MEKRRPARQQSLPATEAAILNKLFDDELATRLNDLFNAGWTLQSMGNAFNPPRRRSTVRSWMVRRYTQSPLETPIPKPRVRTGYVSRRPVSPGISADELAQIRLHAPLARTYRSKMNPDSPQARANLSLTEICIALNEKNVTVKELAEAAGVTYRAMARRLGK